MPGSQAHANQVTSPPPAYVHTPPLKHSPMSAQQATPQQPIASSSPGESASSSSTAVDSFPQRAGDNSDGVDKYAEWYPGDASHDGRPSWWNRLFCCGYGLGCLLCPCGSWTCKHERS